MWTVDTVTQSIEPIGPISGYSQGYPPQVGIWVDTGNQSLVPLAQPSIHSRLCAKVNGTYIGPALDTVKDIRHVNPVLSAYRPAPRYSLGLPPQVITEEDTALPNVNSVPPPVSAGGGGCARAWPKWAGLPEPATNGRGGGGSGDRGGTGVQQRQSHPRHRHCGKFVMPKKIFL